MLTKYAIRFILLGTCRTYVVADEHTIDAIIQALDLLEADVPAMVDVPGLCMIIKAWPEGQHLAVEGEGPVIDTTRGLLLPDANAPLPDQAAAATEDLPCAA